MEKNRQDDLKPMFKFHFESRDSREYRWKDGKPVLRDLEPLLVVDLPADDHHWEL